MTESLVEQFGWQQYVGQEMGARTGEQVLAREIRRYALAIDDPNPRYRGDGSTREELVAPLGYIYWATQDASVERSVGESSEEGFTGFLAIPDIPHIYELGWVRGGDDYEFYQPVRVGDRVTVRYKIAGIEEKEGKSGKLVMITTELKYTNQAGALLATHRITMIGMPRKVA